MGVLFATSNPYLPLPDHPSFQISPRWGRTRTMLQHPGALRLKLTFLKSQAEELPGRMVFDFIVVFILLGVSGALWFYYTVPGGKIIRFSFSDDQLTI